ncbi:guanylate kinase [Natranaerovirga hydrolytica]|uniref:Guanylate kinase n=1 Tax=Natranaerovirga hydrolytica TaxID=680378 RepID=A0A4V2Q1N7_9FIRM|nr:guanylate kinase [Natranaerovirga hydrolytica]TCK98341.1 guanylate kinase [Natranaerovirga hydrolytica]
MNKEGILIVLSGFSGSGKGTITKKLIEEYHYSVSISATTRKPREYEKNGREYFFFEENEFVRMIDNQAFIEWAQYLDNYYGTPKQYVEEQLKAGKDVILEIEMVGALAVKEMYPEAVLIFITPPGIKELKNRLMSRGTESIEVINKRLRRSYDEADVIHKYDYLMVNDDLEKCVKDIHAIIQYEHNKPIRNKEIINQLKNELENIVKGDD